MTAIVGVFCSDGVVIGTDSSATLTHGRVSTVEQKTDKLTIIDNKIIIAGTGAVGLGQRFNAIIQKLWEDKQFSGSYIDVGKKISRIAIEDFSSTYAPKDQYGALVAFPISTNFFLCEFSLTDMQPEFKNEKFWYVSMGCSQEITDTFLAFIRDVFWKDELPKLNQAIFAVTWALDLAVAINPGGVNDPIKIATLRYDKRSQLSACILEDTELEEHRQYVHEAKNYLSEFPKKIFEQSKDLPTPPPK